MTPHQLFRETTVRSRSWPPYAWAIVAGAALSMFIAVVLVAWQGARMIASGRTLDHRAHPAQHLRCHTGASEARP